MKWWHRLVLRHTVRVLTGDDLAALGTATVSRWYRCSCGTVWVR